MSAALPVAPRPKAIRARRSLEYAGLLLMPGEAQLYLGLKRDAFYRARKNDPTFPRPRVVAGLGAACYHRDDLDRWAAALPPEEHSR